jgi:2-iminobutanoate/2-iminopropanoate deaminase
MRTRSALILAIVCLLSACRTPRAATYLNPPGATARPFSEAVRVGNLLYLSGQLGMDPATGQLAAGGIQGETRQVLQNIRTVLERNGSDMDHVVKATVMLADMAEWGRMNEVYVTAFGKNMPARSAFGTNGLARNARVEIEIVALVR